jgi:hypothetical protein
MRAYLQVLLKRLQEKHGKCAEALTKKAAADVQAVATVHTPNVMQTMMLFQPLRAQFCSRQWKKERMNMKINQFVVMYLDTDEIVHPVAPPDVQLLV